jgi:hypothetical protein
MVAAFASQIADGTKTASANAMVTFHRAHSGIT